MTLDEGCVQFRWEFWWPLFVHSSATPMGVLATLEVDIVGGFPAATRRVAGFCALLCNTGVYMYNFQHAHALL